MRAYPIDSPQAVTRLLAMDLVADSEVETMDAMAMAMAWRDGTLSPLSSGGVRV